MSMKKYIKRMMVCALSMAMIVCSAGCSDGGGSTSDRREIGGIPTTTAEETTEEAKRYNTEEIVVITAINTENETISVKKPEESAGMVLSYNGGTVIKSKYGSQLLMEQMNVGEIVRICYVSGTQKLIEMEEYGEAWENTMVTKWDADYEKKLIIIGSSVYNYDENIFLDSDGQSLDIREISGIDELTVRGIGSKVYSVTVNKGHGFVKLTNTVNFVGGIIEIGDRLTAIISADMMLAVPEGEFTLTATINGVGGSKDITVVRGQETQVSLGSFEQSVTRYGTVKLNVLPEDAEAVLTIDGEEVDYSDHLTVAYGEHTLVLTSNNYETVTRDITISSVYSTININMAEEETDEADTETGSDTETESGTTTSDGEANTEGETTTTTNSSVNEAGSNNLICVTAPTNAMVYFDGSYVGTSPVSFTKVSGEHTIILKREGYATKSYTIDVSDDSEDMILSFPEMLAE